MTYQEYEVHVTHGEEDTCLAATVVSLAGVFLQLVGSDYVRNIGEIILSLLQNDSYEFSC